LAGDAGGREDQVAEERRLLYVAMTRARERLFLSWADSYEGTRSWRPSRFLAEVEAAGARRFRRLEVPPLALAPADPEAAIGVVAAGPSGGADGSSPRLSYSGISTYRECPRQYQYRYVHRLPVPLTAEAQYGTILHAALMRLGRLRMQEEAVHPAELNRVYDEVWEELPFPDARRLPALRALGRTQLERYRAEGGFEARPAMVEQPFTAELDGWSLRGIIDRVDPPPTLEGGGRAPQELDSNGASNGAASKEQPWRLIDYKTGDPVPASRLRRDLQLALYALGAKRSLGVGGLELEIVYLKDGSRLRLAADEDLLGEAEAIGRGVAEAVAAGVFEPRPERRRCSLCPYRLACPAAL
jgi:RecB family exonuclease